MAFSVVSQVSQPVVQQRKVCSRGVNQLCVSYARVNSNSSVVCSRKNAKVSPVFSTRISRSLICSAANEETPANNDKDEVAATSTSGEVDVEDLSAPVMPGLPLYGFSSFLSLVGLVETGYLTFLKLTASAPGFCSATGPGCGSVLTSDYSEIFGVPLPALGMLAYGGVLALSVKGALDAKEDKEDTASAGLLGLATILATTSLYLMLTLNLKLDGASCLYCYTSATLSTLIFLSTLPAWKTKDVASGLGVVATMVITLGVGFGDLDRPTVFATQSAEAASEVARTASADIEYPYKEPLVDTVSSRRYVKLAKHLNDTGAKFYGAFWCSHCLDQKLAFGKEAMQYAPYVECFPTGYRQGVQMEPACKAANLNGFPTWVINGEKYEGDQTFDVLAEASGFSVRGE